MLLRGLNYSFELSTNVNQLVKVKTTGYTLSNVWHK